MLAALIVKELQVVSTFVPLVDLAIGTRAKIDWCLIVVDLLESRDTGPIRFLLRIFLRLEALQFSLLGFLHQV